MIYKQRRKLYFVIAIVIAVSFILPGCQKTPVDNQTEVHPLNGQTETSEEIAISTDTGEELRIMFGCDSSTGIPTHRQREYMVSLFSQLYPDVTIRMEEIPTGEEELQRLRTRIMAGDGPDVFLMSENDSLIVDPYRAMTNGLFADISEYYDADTELKKEELNTQIMDAGVYKSGRYILPFSYDMPIAYIDVEQFAADGGDMEMFDGGIMNLYEDIFAAGNLRLATGVSISTPSQLSHGFNFLPKVFDYENEEVLITQDEIAQFLRAVQKARAAETGDRFALTNWLVLRQPNLYDLSTYGENWRDYTSMYIGVMAEHIVNVGFTKLSGIEIAAVPVAAADGDLVVDIPFYGAVGAGCENVELAYEFLRLFLLEEWQQRAFSPDSIGSNGWHVRIQGSAVVLANQQYSKNIYNQFIILYNKLDDPVITDGDIPFLNAEIDRVQFYTSLESEFSDMINTLNDDATDEATDVDIDAMAAEFWDKLYWHLYES